MITFMRRYRKGLQVGLLVVIAAFVASLFVFGSSGFDRGGGRADSVATVNGETISHKQYQERFDVYLEMYARSNRGRLTAEMAETLGLPQRVVDELVTETAVMQRAQAEGLAMSDEEFNAVVHAMREFQDNGRFSIERYRRFLQARGVEGEQDLRRFLTLRKMQRLIVGGVQVTDAEIEQAWALRREEVRAAWALVELPPLVAAATAGDDEIAEYLKTHPDEFKLPERRKVQYVTLVAKDFVPKVTDAEVEKYYTEHVKEFETPRELHASHVLARVPETGGSEAEDRAREKIVAVIRRAKAGEDFARLAREVSDDPASKDKGGDLGWVTAGTMVPAFEQALFALKKGEVTPEPIRTPFGFHAIRVSEVREGARKPLKEVAPQIRDRLGAEAADRAARARADEVRPGLQAAGDFPAEARKLGLAPIETTMSKIGRPPVMPGMPATDTLEEAAFGLSVGGVTTPVNTPAGWVVLKVVDVIPAGVPPLAEIRDRVVAALKRGKGETAAAGRARQLADDARSGDLQAAARKAGATIGEAPAFSRARPIEKPPGDVQMAALQTPTGELSAPVRTPQGYYVVKVLQRAPAGPIDAAEREKLRSELMSQKQSQTWERWVLAARGDAKIELLAPRPSRRG
jgi:peptidyl-prolyl cis-trans isomerase D